MFWQTGVRGRLLIAFFGISALAIVVAAAALISFSSVGQILERITKTHVPAVINTIEISRQAERIVAAAPTLLAAASKDERYSASKNVFTQLDLLNNTLATLRNQENGSVAAGTLAPVVVQLAENLLELDRSVAYRLDVFEQMQSMLEKLGDADKSIQRVLAPSTMVLDAKFSRLYQQANAVGKSDEEREAILKDLTELVAVTLPLQTAQSEAAAINDMLVFSALASSKADIDALAFPLRRSHQNFERILTKVAEKNREKLQSESSRLSELITGADAVPKIRIRELDLVAKGRELVRRNGELSDELTQIVNGLVAEAESQITASGEDAQTAQTIGSSVILIVSVLSLLSAGFVIWRYVSGNLLARITHLSSSMTSIAEGNLHAPLPPTNDTDEIAQMASALKVFRDTAVEVQKSNLIEIQTARQRLQEAIASLSQGFALFDQNDALLNCNARYREIMLGDTQPIEEGTPFQRIADTAANSGRFLAAHNDTDGWRCRLLEKFASGADTSNEQFDSDQWAQMTIRYADQIGTVVVLSDITEVKHISDELGLARDEAEAANEAKSSFLASMSHEVRTPLNGIMGMSTLLSETELNPEQRDFATTINEAAETLLTIINDILDFSKVEAGAMELERIPVDLVETIEGTVELLASKASEKGIEFACQIGQSVPTAILGDSVRLKQILLNLLNNAIKFTDEGEVVLSAQKRMDSGVDDKPTLEIHVRDTGIGIPEDRMERLFKSFSQVDASTTRRYGGTGLGLVITKRLVELMGGEISIESIANQGTTFKVVLPYEEAEIPAAKAVDEMLVILKHSRILVVDDNATNLTILGERLLGWDMTPEIVDHPAKVLSLLRAGHQFDVLITDYKMPDMNGVELARNIKDEFGDAAPPMILYSSVSLLKTELRKKYEEFGFVAQLMKPAKTVQMLNALVAAIRPDAQLSDSGPVVSTEIRGQHQSLEILLVDDNMINRKVGKKILTKFGFDPLLVTSGADAITACKARSFNVVFMDIEMPELDGVKATAMLRSIIPAEKMPYVVALTANAMASDRESYLRSGMDDYLSKPIDIDKLSDCLKRATDHLQQRRTGSIESTATNESNPGENM